MAREMRLRTLFTRPCIVTVLMIIGMACVQDVQVLGGPHGRPDPAPSPNSSQPGLHKTYIVYMGEKPKSASIAIQLYKTIIKRILGEDGSNALIYSYTKSFSAFAVRMTEQHKELMSKFKGIVSIFESQTLYLQTTRSWDFMGFPLSVNHSTTESDIIVGVFDTGVWPESASFSDVGFGPPPAKWKGSCTPPTTNFTCNNKIVGGRHYKATGIFGPDEVPSPRDTEGHGTHTASTAAGSIVTGASMLGLGYGTARGGVPSARLAIYKVCWTYGCSTLDILAAFDDAIADGVDIISISLGGPNSEYYNDVIAIGTYHAMKNGILSSVSAGNDGPRYFTTTNVAPWSLSVAASTSDRTYVTSVQTGNNQIYQGVSLNTFDTLNSTHKLIYAGDAPNHAEGFTSRTSRSCVNNSLDPLLVRDKIVLCESPMRQGAAAFLAGAAGVLYTSSRPKTVARPSILPASDLDQQSGIDIYSYMLNNANATGTIFKTIDGNDTNAPVVAYFSSRGPSDIDPNILKPDISAPGVNILAAWPVVTPVTIVPGDTRSVTYNVKSGTSMSCPHVTAVAAFIKSFHPTWSPAAIKSAIMTTATPMSDIANPEAVYAYGAGHVNPTKALNPGLIYEAGPTDYNNYLCAHGYNTSTLRLLTGDNSECPATGSIYDLNYPSFALASGSSLAIPITTYQRTVTNIGLPNSTYIATVKASPGLNIQIIPNSLTFASVGESKSYALTISGWINETIGIASGTLTWDDGMHQVRSPIGVVWSYLF